jgi:uncharacterized protein
MIKVFDSANSAEVGLLQKILENAGIASIVRNETQAYQGVIFNELWVLHPDDHEKAVNLCRQWRNPEQGLSTAWQCPSCGETLEAQFENCWNCGASKLSNAPSRAAEEHEPGLADVAGRQSAANEYGPCSPPASKASSGLRYSALLFGVLTVAALCYRNWGYLTHEGAPLYYPVHTALWQVDREMLLYDGLRETSRLNRVVLTCQQANISGIPRFCAALLRHMIAFSERTKVPTNQIGQLQATLAILLAETGKAQDRPKYLGALALGSTNIAEFDAAIRPYFETNDPYAFTLNGQVFPFFPYSWAEQKLKIRYRTTLGDHQGAMTIDGSLMYRAEVMSEKFLYTIWSTTVLQMLGFALLIRFWRRTPITQSSRTVVVPWLGWRGVNVFFVSFCLGLGLELLAPFSATLAAVAFTSSNLLVWMPLYLWLAVEYTTGESAVVRGLFGMLPFDSRGKSLLGAGLVFFALGSAALIWVTSAAAAAGLESHWAEGLSEAEHYEPWPTKGLLMLNGIVAAAIGEEIAFRGVLFLALQRWMSPTLAGVASAIAFGGMHFYSWPGFLGVTTFGFFSAMVFHKTKSLIPSILGHVLTNLIWIGGSVWVFAD